ncbi:MAG TPA: ABC transporter ATP-binding protein [Mycobacteriales bacterium]|nr:ABC transporter ATP-binding protein [Mycobacteriales bacterium]
MTLRLDGFGVRVGERRLLEPLDLTVEDGVILAVVGASGSGKTSVLAALAGLAPPSDGVALVDDVPADVVDRRRIGVVTQPVVLAATLTVEENVSLPLQASGHPDEEIDSATEAVLAQLRLDRLAGRLPAQLSGGQRQRVATARAVIGRPRLLVADEPTSELDEASRDRVMDVLRIAAGYGAAVVIATHDAAIADACDQRLILTG